MVDLIVFGVTTIIMIPCMIAVYREAAGLTKKKSASN